MLEFLAALSSLIFNQTAVPTDMVQVWILVYRLAPL